MAKVVTDLKPILGGINTTMKSTGLDPLLEKQASKMAAKCNQIAQISGAEYGYEVVTRRYVRAAMVYAANAEAKIDNQRYNTLKKGCGV